MGYVTTIYAWHGASGSPIFSSTSNKVVAILSNGSTDHAKTTLSGAPVTVRPINAINNRYGITDYINGAKQERVITYLKSIKLSNSAADVRKTLNLYSDEKTLLGSTTLKRVMVEHETLEIRTEIKKFLEDKGMILGNDLE